jgi:hypothetical protein
MLCDRRTQKVRLFDCVVFGYFSISGFAAKDAFRKGDVRGGWQRANKQAMRLAAEFSLAFVPLEIRH